MNAYFDTSAFVPLVLEETATDRCLDLWNQAEKVSSTRLLFVEASSALSRASRQERIDNRTLMAGLDELEDYWQEVALSELDRDLMLGAAAVSHRFGLRGYDAVHCAAAFQINDDEVVAASGDRRLLKAWSELGMHTFNTTG